MAVVPRIPLLVALLAAAAAARAQPAPAFPLRDGDRVVFYGDSITQDGAYGRLVEEYARTRFPQLNLKFYNAGVGGDRVDGGGAGKIGVRLERDVVALHPTVVTIMLGMNDGSYRGPDHEIRDRFATGYRAIVDQLERELPGVRIYLILPSPFDDISRPPDFLPGYDHVLRQLGESVAAIASDHHLPTIDFGTPLNDGLTQVMAADPALARMLLPDRVHPSPAGHLVLGAALLRAWHAPGLVSRVEIDGRRHTVVASEQATVTDLKAEALNLSWQEVEQALPLPLNFADATVALAELAKAGLDDLDREDLTVTGLPEGRYALRIDDSLAGTFTAAQLGQGINLARYNTPMRGQAFPTLWGADGGHEIQLVRRDLMAHGPAGPEAAAAVQTLASWDDRNQAERSSADVPKPHAFVLARMP